MEGLVSRDFRCYREGEGRVYDGFGEVGMGLFSWGLRDYGSGFNSLKVMLSFESYYYQEIWRGG